MKVDELHSPVELKKREVFDELIQRRWGSPVTPSNTQQKNVFKKYDDHEQQEPPTLEVEDNVDSTGKLINQQPAYDQIMRFNYNLVKKWSLARSLKELLDQMGKSQEPMTTIHISTQSSMMWNSLMAKSKSMQPTLLLKTC